MKKLSQIKSKLKKSNDWKIYKDAFGHKQMKLVTSKIALVFNEDINVETFYQLEKSLITAPINVDMFKEAFKILAKEVKYKADWEELGIFMWYAYQTSTFYKDQKNHVENIYTLENSVELNGERRAHFLKWLHSVDKTDIEFNNKIIAVQKLVL